jgi:hypothetical protein
VSPVLPKCIALILCDDVRWDASRTRVDLLGGFYRVEARRFPTVISPFKVWIELTDGHGLTPMTLRIARLTVEDVDGRLVAEAPFTASFANPRGVIHHLVNFHGIELDAAGEYR